MSDGLIETILDSIFNSVIQDKNEWLGRYGEKLTARELKWVNLFGRKGKTLRNIYIPKGNGQTSEIDLIYITQSGKELTLRIAKKGANAGKQFYGCTGFPSCRYIENL